MVLCLVVKKEIRILLLEDNEADAELIQFAMRQADLPFTLTRVESEADFLNQLHHHTPDVILLDYSVPGFDGLKALTLAQQNFPDLPSIFVTGTLGDAAAGLRCLGDSSALVRGNSTTTDARETLIARLDRPPSFHQNTIRLS